VDGYKQIVSAEEVLSLPKGTIVICLIDEEEHRGTIARDYQAGGLVYFQADPPDPHKRFSGWINPKKLQTKT